MNQAMRSIHFQEDDCRFLLTVMPRPHRLTSAIMECNHKVQILFVSSPGMRSDFGALVAADAAAITLQFQWVRGLGNRRRAACGIRGRVVAKLVRCQGG